MKKLKFLLILLSVIIIVLVLKNQIFSSIIDTQIITELNKVIVESDGNDPILYTDAFLNNITNWGDYTVIGLGEATHGTRNFFRLKHRLFKYLVENHGFKALAYEFSFQSSLKVNDYILNGVGSIDSVFLNEYWIQDNKEVQDLIEWMRTYNLDKKDADKIQFIGIDNQRDAYTPTKILEYFDQIFPDFTLAYPQIIMKIKDLKPPKYREMSHLEYLDRESIYHRLYRQAKAYFNTRKITGSNINKEFLLHLIQSVIQSNEFLYRFAVQDYNVRDYQLATNTLWVKEYMGNAGVVVWAHNAHVAKNPDYYPEGKGGGAMGIYLRDLLGKKYLSVASSFSEGEFVAVMSDSLGNDTEPMVCKIAGDPPKKSLNHYFKQLQYSNFVLNIDELEQNTRLYNFLNKLKPMIGVGDWYAGNPEMHFTNDRIINLIQAYDVLFYFADTEPVSIIKR